MTHDLGDPCPADRALTRWQHEQQAARREWWVGFAKLCAYAAAVAMALKAMGAI